MKKLPLFMMLGLLLISMVAAPIPQKTLIDISTGNANTECTQAGFDFGIAKWEYQNNAYVLVDTEHAGYTTSVTGTATQANWTSTPGADGVLSKEGNEHFLLAGGTSGTIYKGDHGISHVTLCGNNATDVPEFGVFAALGVLGLAGLFIFKRRTMEE